MPDTRKPLFPDDDEDPMLPESEAPAEDVVEVDYKGEIVETPPEERFPPLNPAVAAPEVVEASPRRHRTWPLNLITAFFALATLGLLAYFALLWAYPSHPLNPLPPYTPLPIIITATFQPVSVTPVPSATGTPTPASTATFTPIPAAALPATLTFTPAAFPFTLAESGVEYVANTNDDGCAWSGIAGNIVDLQGEGLADYSVRIRSQEGDLNATVATGAAATFGPGGFELKLDEQAALAAYIIQLLSPNGEPLSEEYLVVTSDQCDQNVAVVNFVQNR